MARRVRSETQQRAWRKKDSNSLESISCCQRMNVARIHDKQNLRFFWERRIDRHMRQMDEEESRRKSSALTRLRMQWLVKLDQRNEHQRGFLEERIRRSQNARQRLAELHSASP